MAIYAMRCKKAYFTLLHRASRQFQGYRILATLRARRCAYDASRSYTFRASFLSLMPLARDGIISPAPVFLPRYGFSNGYFHSRYAADTLFQRGVSIAAPLRQIARVILDARLRALARCKLRLIREALAICRRRATPHAYHAYGPPPSAFSANAHSHHAASHGDTRRWRTSSPMAAPSHRRRRPAARRRARAYAQRARRLSHAARHFIITRATLSATTSAYFMSVVAFLISMRPGWRRYISAISLTDGRERLQALRLRISERQPLFKAVIAHII